MDTLIRSFFTPPPAVVNSAGAFPAFAHLPQRHPWWTTKTIRHPTRGRTSTKVARTKQPTASRSRSTPRATSKGSRPCRRPRTRFLSHRILSGQILALLRPTRTTRRSSASMRPRRQRRMPIRSPTSRPMADPRQRIFRHGWRSPRHPSPVSRRWPCFPRATPTNRHRQERPMPPPGRMWPHGTRSTRPPRRMTSTSPPDRPTCRSAPASRGSSRPARSIRPMATALVRVMTGPAAWGRNRRSTTSPSTSSPGSKHRGSTVSEKSGSPTGGPESRLATWSKPVPRPARP